MATETNRSFRNLLIWGTGNYSKRVISYVDDVNQEFGSAVYRIIGFIDNNQQKHGTNVTGIKIFPPAGIERLISENNAVLVIAVKDSQTIEAQLARLGINLYLKFQEFVREEKLTRQLVAMSLTIKFPQRLVHRLQIKEEILRMKNVGLSYKEARSKLGCEGCISGMAGLFGENITDANEFIGLYANINEKKKKVCQAVVFCTVRFYNGGIERVLSHLIKLFVEHGIRVVLISEHKDENFGEYELPEQVSRYETVKYTVHPDTYILQIAEILKKEKPDAFCMHSGTDSKNYYASLLAAEYGVIFISEIHNTIRFLHNEQLKLIYRFTDTVVTLSSDWASQLNSLGLKAVYIPNPVFLPKEGAKASTASNVILWVGRIENKQKNVYDTVEVMQRIITIMPDVVLKIVGGADDSVVWNNLVRKIDDAGMSGSIQLAGYHTDVSPFYREASVLIMTSSFEGFPMVLAEALGHGLPVIMYNLPYLEMVKIGKGITTVSMGNKDEMAESVINILENKKLHAKLSSEAIENATFFSKIDLMSAWKNILNG